MKLIVNKAYFWLGGRKQHNIYYQLNFTTLYFRPLYAQTSDKINLWLLTNKLSFGFMSEHHP